MQDVGVSLNRGVLNEDFRGSGMPPSMATSKRMGVQKNACLSTLGTRDIAIVFMV